MCPKPLKNHLDQAGPGRKLRPANQLSLIKNKNSKTHCGLHCKLTRIQCSLGYFFLYVVQFQCTVTWLVAFSGVLLSVSLSEQTCDPFICCNPPVQTSGFRLQRNTVICLHIVPKLPSLCSLCSLLLFCLFLLLLSLTSSSIHFLIHSVLHQYTLVELLKLQDC